MTNNNPLPSEVFRTKFGSHLYGTDTPNSDTDYKAVFVQPVEEIILGRKKDNVLQNTNKSDARNTSVDVDVEYIELRKFLHDCWTGQTYALDMLFSNREMWIATSPLWEEIIAHRDKLLSKNVAPYIGYCRRQAGKYGLRGSRLGELLRVIEWLELADAKSLLVDALNGFSESEFVTITTIETPSKGHAHFLEVLGKKYDLRTFVNDALIALYALKDRYGARAEEAMENKGIDWKAVSHAFRCCYQLIELAETGAILFPLKEAAKLKKIKQGELDYPPLQEELYDLMERAIQAVEQSQVLPDEPDKEFWEGFILKTYLG